MKILVTYFCSKCESKEMKEIDLSSKVPVSLELPCKDCGKQMTALYAIEENK